MGMLKVVSQQSWLTTFNIPICNKLKGVATDDRAEAAAIADGTRLIKELLVSGGGTTGEDDDTPAIKRALDDVVDALGLGCYGHFVFLVGFLGLRQFHLRAGQLDLDDIGTHLGSNLGRVCNHIYSRLTLFTKAAAAWIGPDHHCKARRLGFFSQFAQLLVYNGTL